jgi:hypothetical protein
MLFECALDVVEFIPFSKFFGVLSDDRASAGIRRISRYHWMLGQIVGSNKWADRCDCCIYHVRNNDS